MLFVFNKKQLINEPNLKNKNNFSHYIVLTLHLQARMLNLSSFNSLICENISSSLLR